MSYPYTYPACIILQILLGRRNNLTACKSPARRCLFKQSQPNFPICKISTTKKLTEVSDENYPFIVP